MIYVDPRGGGIIILRVVHNVWRNGLQFSSASRKANPAVDLYDILHCLVQMDDANMVYHATNSSFFIQYVHDMAVFYSLEALQHQIIRGTVSCFSLIFDIPYLNL